MVELGYVMLSRGIVPCSWRLQHNVSYELVCVRNQAKHLIYRNVYMFEIARTIGFRFT